MFRITGLAKSKISSINIPNSVINIGYAAFQQCSNLTSIVIPNSVTSIEEMGFQQCTNLTSIVIQNGLTSIGGYAFQQCSNLTRVEIPNSVTNIADWAFNRCYNLEVVDFRTHTTVPTLGGYSAFIEIKSCQAIIPDNLYNEWIVATNWNTLYTNGIITFVKASEFVEE